MLLVLGMREPPRGIQDAAAAVTVVVAVHGVHGVPSEPPPLVQSHDVLEAQEEDSHSATVGVGWPEALRSLLCNAHYMHALGAVTLVSFASGGIADWLPTWLTRVQHMTIGAAGMLVGLITCLAGVGGSLVGYLLGESLTNRGVRNAYFVIGAGSQVASCAFSGALLAVGSWASLPAVGALIFLCQFCMWLNVGGCSALIANAVHPRIRSRAFGLSILVSHLGGDAISPSLVGLISDRNQGNLTLAFGLVPLAFGLAALVFAFATFNLRGYEQQQVSVRKRSQQPTHSLAPARRAVHVHRAASD